MKDLPQQAEFDIHHASSALTADKIQLHLYLFIFFCYSFLLISLDLVQFELAAKNRIVRFTQNLVLSRIWPYIGVMALRICRIFTLKNTIKKSTNMRN